MRRVDGRRRSEVREEEEDLAHAVELCMLAVWNAH